MASCGGQEPALKSMFVVFVVQPPTTIDTMVRGSVAPYLVVEEAITDKLSLIGSPRLLPVTAGTDSCSCSCEV